MAPAPRGRLERLWGALDARPRWRQVAFWAAWWLPPLAARVLMHVGRGVWPSAADLRGALSDSFVASGCTVLALGWLRWRGGAPSRMALAVVGVFWTLFNYAASEHVVALDAPIDLRLIGYLGDETFLAGTWTMIEHPIVLLGLLFFAPVALYRWSSGMVPSRAVLRAALATLLGMGVASWLWAPSVTEVKWRQMHFLEFLATSSFTGEGVEALALDDSRIEEMFRPQLEGERRVPVPSGRPNVLLVLVEGMTGAYVPAVAAAHGLDYHLDMSRIDERAQRSGLLFTSFVNHQRQTNRGEYTLLCGDYPKLSSATSKMSDYVIARDRPCLPEILRQAGYYTAYLQAANLRFMMKDQFMARAGFDDVRGAEYFTEGYARSGWGVDDRALFEGVLGTLEAYERKGQPWFATVLTVGTHAPFPVPEQFEGEGDEPSRERAFRYADLALDELLEGLERKGLADNTLVLVTSDESAGLEGDGYGDLLQTLGTNWGVLVAFGPGIEPGRDTGVFVQSDVAISILDYLGLADSQSPFVGRSVFRRNDAPRRVGFANAYSHVQYSLDERGGLVMCPEIGDDCAAYQLQPAEIFAGDAERRAATRDEIAFLRGVVARAEVTRASLDRGASQTQSLELIDRAAARVRLQPAGEATPILSGQAIMVPPDRQYHVELRYRVVGPGATVFVNNALMTRGETLRMQPWANPLVDGDRVTLDYVYAPGQLTYDVDVVLRAFAQNQPADGEDSPGTLVVEHAVARLEPLSADETNPVPITINEFSLQHADGSREDLPYHHVDLSSSMFERSDCVTRRARDGTWIGKACAEGELVGGPHSFVPRGGSVRASLALRGTQGQGRGHLELRLRNGAERHGDLREYGLERGFTISPGSRTELSVEARAAADQEDVAVYLVLDEAEPIRFEIERLELEVLAPEDLIRWRDGGVAE